MFAAVSRAALDVYGMTNGFALPVNLVDPASSHMLVSKIKPCMCECTSLVYDKLHLAHYINYRAYVLCGTWIAVVILHLIHAQCMTYWNTVLCHFKTILHL